MEMKDNDQKKMLLSVLGVAILVVAVIGISFAAYTTTFETSDNAVSTGSIMVSYLEPTNAINIQDAMPLSDADGMALTGAGKTFDFTVSTKADSALTVPYEVNLIKVASSSTLTDSQIKVYLTKDETAVTETSTPVLVADLDQSEVRSGALVLHKDQDTFSAGNTAVKSSSYVFRMWIDKNVAIDNENSKEYHVKINVDSSVKSVA